MSEVKELEREANEMEQEREQLTRLRKAKDNRKLQRKLLKEERRKHSLIFKLIGKVIEK